MWLSWNRMCAEKCHRGRSSPKKYILGKNFIAGPPLSALVGSSSYRKGKSRNKTKERTIPFSWPRTKVPRTGATLLSNRWKSVDKLCGFREPFFSAGMKVPTVGKSGCIRSRTVIKPTTRIAYTVEIIDYPALISEQVGHFENQTVTSLSLRHSLVYSFAILLRLSGRRGPVF